MSSHLPSRVLCASVLAGALLLPGLALAEPVLGGGDLELGPTDTGAGGVDLLPADELLLGPSTRMTTAQQTAGQELHGVFGITAGECAGDGVTSGSYFRMVNPGGNPESGPFVGNGNSSCGDNTYTPLLPGTDGGLSTAAYQPHPDPPFSPTGGGANDKITQPTPFFGVAFSAATEATDRQTGLEVPLPQITFDCAGGLHGDVRGFQAAWNRQFFNQGSPKPDGSTPEGTTGPEGTYDPATQAYALTWTSRIVGGPFNNFTGVWRLEGTFSGQAQGTCPAGAVAGGAPGPAAAQPAPAAASQPGGAAQTGTGGGTLADTGGTSGSQALAMILVLGGAALWALQRRAGRLS